MHSRAVNPLLEYPLCLNKVSELMLSIIFFNNLNCLYCGLGFPRSSFIFTLAISNMSPFIALSYEMPSLETENFS